ncbi:DUF3080 family protein [Alteromonas sp. CYL-A6]|uniref:DUF3080 family protein n=1 Tax=Alteromonas nitratireducens TaxID=3390813 RepID=UPI0034B1AD06
MQIPWRSIIGGLLIAGSLTGCSGGDPLRDATEEYRDRLSRVLDVPLPDLPETGSLAYPDAQALQVAIAPVSVNLRDFYALKDCALYTLIAERNTSTGKVQQPSQRLVYEAAFIRAADDCIHTLNSSNPALSARLADIQQQKLTQYERVWATLIQRSEALHYAFALPNGLLKQEENRDAGAAVVALHYLDKRHQPGEVTSAELEEALQQSASARLPAKLWLTQQYLTNALTTLTPALSAALDNIACPEGRAPEQAKILRNVFYLFFIRQIQPVGSVLNDYHYQLDGVFSRWQTTPALSPVFRDYLTRYATDGFNAYQSAMREHVALWQAFLGRCNLSPQAPSAS